MNTIEKDIRAYFGISSSENILEHYGTKKHSGRYPWGSGDNPYQHSGDFLSRIETLKKKGLSEKGYHQRHKRHAPQGVSAEPY